MNKWLIISLLSFFANCFGMDRNFLGHEQPYKTTIAYKVLFQIKAYCREYSQKRLLPILISSPSIQFNHIIAFTLHKAIGKKRWFTPDEKTQELPIIDEEGPNKEVTLIACQLSTLLHACRKKANDALENIGKQEKEKVIKNPDSEFFQQLKQFKKPKRLLIATETNTKSLPKSIMNLFLHEEGTTPFPTILRFPMPNEKMAQFNEMTNFFETAFTISLELNNYLIYDSRTGYQLSDPDSLFALAYMFADFNVPDLLAKEIMHEVAPKTTEPTVLWTKTIIKEIAKRGSACSRCLVSIHNKKHVSTKSCCSKALCEKCFKDRCAWSKYYKNYSITKKVCPLCNSKQENNFKVIDPLKQNNPEENNMRKRVFDWLKIALGI